MTANYKASIREIAAEEGLRLYGLCLALVHLATFALWYPYFFGPSMLNGGAPSGPSVCWPFFPQCYVLNLNVRESSIIGIIYFILAIATPAFFLLRKISLAYWSLIISCLFKLAIMCIDYRLMGDYHYITLIVTLCYLFVPGKWNLARVLIVGFYFSAGTLKFNNEWLSGSALIDDPKIYGIALEWLCLYVIVLETCMAPLLLFTKSRVVAALVLAQLFLFHVYSYLIVGFFFPTIYFLLLAVFPLSWKSKATLRLASLTKVDWIAITLFVLAQMIPTLQSGDPALVGRGRHFAVHIMDATSECFPRFTFEWKKRRLRFREIIRCFHSASAVTRSYIGIRDITFVGCIKGGLVSRV